MGCNLSGNIGRIPKSLMGGINKLYLFPYVKHSRSQIILSNQSLMSFPSTTIFEIDVNNANYSENSSNEKGSIIWTQSFNFSVPKISEGSELFKLPYNDYRAIFIDRIGNIRLLGLFNGLTMVVSNDTGNGKNDNNGYKITIEGKEDNQAYYLSDLNDFKINIRNNYTFQDGCNYVFQDNNNFTFNN